MSREKSIWNSASLPNGICTNVCVGNAFMRSETPVNLCGSLDGTMERHAPAKPPLCKEGQGGLAVRIGIFHATWQLISIHSPFISSFPWGK